MDEIKFLERLTEFAKTLLLPPQQAGIEKAASREELREARAKRAKKYGIAAKEGGHLTPPKGYPTSPDDFGDPVNYVYPLDPGRRQAARSYFNHEGQREAGGYTSAEWAVVGKRIASASGEAYEYKDGKVMRKEEKGDVSLGEAERRIRDAWYAMFRERPYPSPIEEKPMWVREVFEDKVIVEISDGLLSYPYTVTDTGIEFGQPDSVEVEYRPTGKVEKSFYVPIAKADAAKHLVYGVVLEPDAADGQGDTISAEEIERACHSFMLRSQALDLEHERELDKVEAAIVENYIASQELTWERDGQATTVPPGSWVMVTKVFSRDIWRQVEDGALTGYSIRGWGVRNEVG